MISHFNSKIDLDLQTSLLPFITKRETPEKIVFLIDPPPKPGFYKLQIYARKKPKARGRLKIPLIANFLVDFRLNGGNSNKSSGMQPRTASAATTALLNSGRSSLVAQLQQRSSSLNSKASNQVKGRDQKWEHESSIKLVFMGQRSS